MNRDLLTQELERDEGIRLKVYKDSLGIETIGIGRNLRDVGISKAEAYMLLGADIDSVERDLDRALPWWRQLSDNRQRVLANMCFNLGINRLLGFKNTLAAMKEGRYADAAEGMLASKWASQVGQRAVRLANMMKEG